LTKFHTSKFEFIFTNFVRDSPRLFTTIQTVFRAYDTSRMYRDLKLRGALISDKELKLLPEEQIYSQVRKQSLPFISNNSLHLDVFTQTMQSY